MLETSTKVAASAMYKKSWAMFKTFCRTQRRTKNTNKNMKGNIQLAVGITRRINEMTMV